MTDEERKDRVHRITNQSVKDMSYELLKCEITGNEFGDARHPVAIAKEHADLVTYCKAVLKTEPVLLNSINCPITEHRHLIVNDTYYTIVPSKVEVIDQNYFRLES